LTGRRSTIARILVALAIVVPSVAVAPGLSLADPQIEERRDQALERLRNLEHNLEVKIEAFNDLRYLKEQAQARERAAAQEKREAQTAAAETIDLLEERAIDAYTSAGARFDTLFDAASFTEFSDRLQFMGAIAQNDADLAVQAQTAAQRARWAEERHAAAAAEFAERLERAREMLEDIEDLLAEQRALYEELDRKVDEYYAAQRAAAEANANDLAGSGGGTPGGNVANCQNQGTPGEVAVCAALAVEGTQYVWGSADPSVGFDCSGLTSWAWAQAGVYLPHSSGAQHSSLPHVPLGQARAGDILYFFNPVSHVALYMGGGMMIHARHPGPGGQVQVASISSYARPYSYVGRPG
jgi:cell wall-associated NlpC family hydrolase